MMDNLEQQIDEIEALAAIYGDNWQTEDIENRAYSVGIPDGDNYVRLYLKLPADYPSMAPPQYEISAPHLKKTAKLHLGSLLDEVYSSYVGETVIYQWVEKIREELQLGTVPDPTEIDDPETVEEAEVPVVDSEPPATISIPDCPVIYHGEVILDRKSSFQGHAAKVTSVDQVKQVLSALLSNRKIEQATHNIYSYRIFREEKKTFYQDYDDDGESQAGGRLLHFLEVVDARNVLVVVSRWYGGVHLGPDRFRHITNAARQVLQDSQLISNKPQHQKK